jgi:outer membrane protein assembly factor BamB
VIAGSLDGKVYAVESATGESPWVRPFDTSAPVRAAPVLAGNKIIVVDREGHVYGLDPDDGTQAPAVDLDLTGDVLADPLLMPDGSVLIVTTGGDVVRIDPQTLTIVDERKL